MDAFQHWISILNVSIYAGLLAVVSFLAFYQKLDKNEKWITGVVLLYTGCDLVATWLIFQGKQNLWLYNWALLPQLLVVTFVMVESMKSVTARRIFFGGTLMLASLHFLNLLFFQGYEILANFTYIPAYGWMAVIAFYYLKEQLEDVTVIPFNCMITWFALATLIDNAGSLPILSVLGWSNFITMPVAYHLFDIVTWLYAFWFFILLTGLLWTKTSLRSAFFFR